MNPILVVSAAAIVGLTVINLAWSRYTRGLRARTQLLQAELAGVRSELSVVTDLRGELASVRLRVQDLNRNLYPGRPVPDALMDALDRIEESFDVHRKANRAVRRQLSRTVDRLRDSQKDIQRLNRELNAARAGAGRDSRDYLENVTSERDALKCRVSALKSSLEAENIEDRARLLQARRELEELRFQLRGAYRAIADLEARTPARPQTHAPVDGCEPTDMILPAGTDFEIM
jgi:chromosome segregation ATPase